MASFATKAQQATSRTMIIPQEGHFREVEYTIWFSQSCPMSFNKGYALGKMDIKTALNFRVF